MYQHCQKDALRLLQHKVEKSQSFELDINLFGTYKYETNDVNSTNQKFQKQKRNKSEVDSESFTTDEEIDLLSLDGAGGTKSSERKGKRGTLKKLGTKKSFKVK